MDVQCKNVYTIDKLKREIKIPDTLSPRNKQINLRKHLTRLFSVYSLNLFIYVLSMLQVHKV